MWERLERREIDRALGLREVRVPGPGRHRLPLRPARGGRAVRRGTDQAGPAGAAFTFVPRCEPTRAPARRGARNGRVVLERVGRAGTTLRSAEKITSSADGRAAVACRRYPPRTR